MSCLGQKIRMNSKILEIYFQPNFLAKESEEIQNIVPTRQTPSCCCCRGGCSCSRCCRYSRLILFSNCNRRLIGGKHNSIVLVCVFERRVQLGDQIRSLVVDQEDLGVVVDLLQKRSGLICDCQWRRVVCWRCHVTESFNHFEGRVLQSIGEGIVWIPLGYVELARNTRNCLKR